MREHSLIAFKSQYLSSEQQSLLGIKSPSLRTHLKLSKRRFFSISSIDVPVIMSTKASIFIFFALSASRVVSQSIYINLIPEYSSLSSCAISPLSTIVRGMGAGCGDGSALTSYSCFCTDSSSYFSSMISSVVLAQCATDPSQASSAVNVFDSYCAVGTSSQPYPKQTGTGGFHYFQF